MAISTYSAKLFRRVFVALAMLSCFPFLGNPATAQAIDGSLYGVIGPTFSGTLNSYIRLFNGGGAASTFNITLVGSPSGRTYGTAAISIPKNASPQYSLASIVSLANAAALNGGDKSYSMYIKNSEIASGFQHVTYDSFTGFFENVNACRYTFNNPNVLINVHSSLFAANYPSVVELHNYYSAATTYSLTVVDGVTGATLGSMNQNVGANATVELSILTIEQAIGFAPTANQQHLNIFVTNPSGGEAKQIASHLVNNVPLHAALNLTTICAINAQSSSPTAPVVVQQPSSKTIVLDTLNIIGHDFKNVTVSYSEISSAYHGWKSGTFPANRYRVAGNELRIESATIDGVALTDIILYPSKFSIAVQDSAISAATIINGKVTVSWSSFNTTSCSLSGGGYSTSITVPSMGQIQFVPQIQDNQVYQLKCDGPDGPVVATATASPPTSFGKICVTKEPIDPAASLTAATSEPRYIGSFIVALDTSNNSNPGDVSSCAKGSVSEDGTLTLIASSAVTTGKVAYVNATFGGTPSFSSTSALPMKTSSLSPKSGFGYSLVVKQTPTPDLAPARYLMYESLLFSSSPYASVLVLQMQITTVCGGACSSGLSSMPTVNIGGEDYRVLLTSTKACNPCGDGLSTGGPAVLIFYKLNFTSQTGTVPLKAFSDYAVSRGLLRASDYLSSVSISYQNLAGDLTSTLNLKVTK